MAETQNNLTDTVQAFRGAKAAFENVLTVALKAVVHVIDEIRKSLPPNFVSATMKLWRTQTDLRQQADQNVGTSHLSSKEGNS